MDTILAPGVGDSLRYAFFPTMQTFLKCKAKAMLCTYGSTQRNNIPESAVKECESSIPFISHGFYFLVQKIM